MAKIDPQFCVIEKPVKEN